MLKRLLKRPALWSLLVLAGCAVWQLRPIVRSALFPVQFANGKYGFVNLDGRVVVAGVWDGAFSFAADGRALVKKDDKYGFIDREGRLCAPLGSEVQEKSCPPFMPMTRGSDLFWGEKQIEHLHSGQLVSARDWQMPLWKQKPQKFGLRQGGKVIVEPVWDDIWPFDAADLAAVKREGKLGFINRSQKIVIPLDWDWALPFAKNGLALIMKDGKCGFIDRTGKIVIPPEWDEASSFHDNGLACVKKDTKAGFIDRTGKIVIPLEYRDALEFDHQNMARISIDGRQGFIAPTGSLVVPLEWEQVWDFDDRQATPLPEIERIDSDGGVDPRYVQMARLDPNTEGLAPVHRNGKYGCINRKGDIIINPEWDELFHFDASGFAAVERNGKHGLINRKGEIVIPLEWDEMYRFDNRQMALVKKGEKYGYIDRAGKIVLPLVWDYAWEFSSDDLATVSRGGKCGIINRKGEIVFPLIWEGIGHFDAGDKAYVNKDKKLGIINRKGETIIPTEWDALIDLKENASSFFGIRTGCVSGIDPLTPNVLLALKDKKTGYIDWAGNIIIAPEWDAVFVRTDAGSEQCCFVVSRSVDDGVQPGWMKTTRDWFFRLIGRAEQRNTLCHLYATDGRLLWSSDWLSSAFWSLVLAALAGVVLIGDVSVLLRRRRGANLATLSEPRTQ